MRENSLPRRWSAVSILAGATVDATSSFIASRIQSKAQASKLLFTALIAAFSFGETGPTPSPVLLFLTQANRIRAGRSNVSMADT